MSYLTRAYPSYAGKFGSWHGREDRNRSEDDQFPVDEDSFTCTIPKLVDHMKMNPGQIEVKNLGYLVGLVTSRGLPLHSTAVHFNRSDEHRDGHVAINGRSYAPKSTHNEHFHKNGNIFLTPRDYCRGGEVIRIDGREFSPDEGIQINTTVVYSQIDRSDTTASADDEDGPGQVMAKSDLYGRFVLLLNVPTMPRGMKSIMSIRATGQRSAKISSKSIHVG